MTEKDISNPLKKLTKRQKKILLKRLLTIRMKKLKISPLSRKLKKKLRN